MQGTLPSTEYLSVVYSSNGFLLTPALSLPFSPSLLGPPSLQILLLVSISFLCDCLTVCDTLLLSNKTLGTVPQSDVHMQSHTPFTFSWSRTLTLSDAHPPSPPARPRLSHAQAHIPPAHSPSATVTHSLAAGSLSMEWGLLSPFLCWLGHLGFTF
jgi:hypothetical protein